MQYCNHCQVYIKENKEICSLCNNDLSNYDVTRVDSEYFPIVRPYYKKHLAIKIMIFISIVSIVISFAIHTIFPSEVNWPLLLLFGLISIWLGLIFIVERRHHIPKKIIRQVVIVSLLAMFWDWKVGWRGWSLDYIIPIACIIALVIMYITAKIMKLSINDYITYSLIDGLFGIIPILFIIFDLVNVKYPSIISVSLSLISLSAIFIFHGEEIKAEIDKRMHI